MHDYTSLAICTLVVNWTLTSIAFLFQLAIVSSKLHAHKIRLDDILVFSAFLISVVLVSLSTWAIVDEGQGKHQQNLSVPHLEIAAKSLLVSEALLTLVTSLLRIAASLCISRIFGVQPVVPPIALGIMVLSVALGMAAITEIFLICQPFAAQWDPRVLGTCGDQVTSFMIIESTGLLLDIAILMLPPIFIFGLCIEMKKRVLMALIMSIGAVVLIVTGPRMAALHKAVSPDFTYSQSYLSLLSSAGCMSSIICCSATALPAKVRVPEPTVINPRNMMTVSRLGKRANDRDLENAPDLASGTHDGDDEQSMQEAVIGCKNTVRLRGDQLAMEAVALVDFHGFRKNELPLKQGQLVRIVDRQGFGWLVAQNLTTNEIGLVPETFVELRSVPL